MAISSGLPLSLALSRPGPARPGGRPRSCAAGAHGSLQGGRGGRRRGAGPTAGSV